MKKSYYICIIIAAVIIIIAFITVIVLTGNSKSGVHEAKSGKEKNTEQTMDTIKDEAAKTDNNDKYDDFGQNNAEHDSTEHAVSADNCKYYLKLEDDGIINIYVNDKLYDYAEINVQNIPSDTISELKSGMWIKDDEELYDFLQTYSS